MRSVNVTLLQISTIDKLIKYLYKSNSQLVQKKNVVE